MERWKETQLKQLAGTTDLETAYVSALGFAKNIGFKYFAFTATYKTENNQANTVQWNNFPTNWNEEYEQKQLSAMDPIVALCNQGMLPVLWTKELFNAVPSYWESLKAKGLRHGWSQSVHDEHSGLCSIMSMARSHRAITVAELYANLGFSIFIIRHIHAIIGRSLPKQRTERSPPSLSSREIDVLKLAAAGKTADESAKILNLSPRTIHFHIQSAIEKLGVHNKISAIIAAIKAGQLSSTSLSGR
jgi:DNA-binding CsgD family transcriptional regulator